MPIPIAPPIHIPKEVYPILEGLIKSGKSEKRLVERASYIVRMGEKVPNTQIAKEFKVQNNTVKKWRARWLEGEECLQSIVAKEQSEKQRTKELAHQVRKILTDKQRPGVAMKYTAEQYCRILQVALEPPSESGRPINDWSSRELAQEVNKRGICKRISASQVGRFLKKRATLNRIR
ncbi:MAG: helix-turn-helix domain-containing protein [Flavobacteriales bacterium]|nr:helix-turn-helix domain-containing protein [Flavobacteriales bacterium]